MENYNWWQKGIIYQVYPRSFQDRNNDGIGDLQGIKEKLGYLKWLGVDAIWLSPIYPSPMADFGYDISDYTNIDPIFGTLKDFDKLLEKTHQEGMKLIMDLVPNHTSDMHPWFLESKSSRDNPKRDWYIWKDPSKNGGPPNNWLSMFGGEAWEFDETTGQYYYHAFHKKQPDLNWRNPKVQEAMFDIMEFWFKKGIDGFRIDVLWHIIKDKQFRNNPPNPDYRPGTFPYNQLMPIYSTDREEVHDLTEKIRSVADKYPGKLLIGEIYLPLDKLVKYYGKNNRGVHLPFNFQLVLTEWNASQIFHLINYYEGLLPKTAWPNWVLGNHDKPRVASRLGREQAKVAAIMLLTLRGTPTIYYGEEIGMIDVPIPVDKIADPQELNMPGIGLGRDPVRTPMQWDSSQYGGFSSSDPWLPLSKDYKVFNVEQEIQEDTSFLSLYKDLITLRKKEPALSIGKYEPIDLQDDLIVYRRVHENKKFLVILNLGTEKTTYIPDFVFTGEIVANVYPGKKNKKIKDLVSIDRNEGVVIRLDK